MEEKASSGLWRLEANNPQQSNLWGLMPRKRIGGQLSRGISS
jgi:hypothetical protein